MKRLLLLLWAAAVFGVTCPALASEPADPVRVPGVVAGASPERRPVWCTPLGCRRAPSAAWTWIAGFGAASWAASRIARRHRGD